MFRKTFRMLLPLALMAAPLSAAEWMTDYTAAKAKAAAENKAVLLDFTGSDWCGWCIRLRNDVLDKPAFDAYAKDKFVLVEVDMPRDPAKLSPEQRQANEALCKQFRISGFPTLIVTTPEGAVTGGFVGGRADEAGVEQPLDKALEVGRQLAEAARLEGEPKLQALTAAYQAIPKDLQDAATGLRDEIAALDTEDTTGIRHQAAVRAQQEEIAADVQAATTEADAIARIDAWLEKAMPENKFELYYNKSNMMMMTAESVADLEAAEKVAYQAYECMPEADKPRAKAALERIFGDKEATLKQIKAQRENAFRAVPVK